MQLATINEHNECSDGSRSSCPCETMQMNVDDFAGEESCMPGNVAEQEQLERHVTQSWFGEVT